MRKENLVRTILSTGVGVMLLGCIYAFSSPGINLPPDKNSNVDSIASPYFIKRQIAYDKIYPFINYSQNYIEWTDYSAVSGLFDKIKKTPNRKLKVLHIGDSHVQADIFTGYIRKEMQQIFGIGGRGFVFPYAAAATHSAYDYTSTCKGKWDYSRNIQPYPAYDMGISGATIHTEDSSASFKLVFPRGTLNENDNILKIYCKRMPESFDLKVKASGVESPLYIDCNSFNDKLYLEIKLPKASDTLEFFVNKTDTIQKYFECYGLQIETSENSGVLYNSVGINGAALSSILKENILLYQLSEYKPDLVILDLGLNDFYKVPFNQALIEKNLNNIIDIIYRASPDACIILSDAQDVYYRYWNEANCKTYAALMRKVAFQKGCAFYDYYSISGGQYSMLKWSANKLAQYDKVHLTSPGYIVRGELFLNALLNSYSMTLTKPELKSLIAAVDFKDTTKTDVKVIDKHLPEIKEGVTTSAIQEQQTQVWKTQTYYYKIKNGDNLGSIANKYGVTVRQLQQWNGIKGTAISAGKNLVIYKQVLTYQKEAAPVASKTIPAKKPQTVVAPQTKPKPTATTTTTTKPTTQTAKPTATKGAVKHTVKSGDSLWDIAQKYNVTVDQIKKLNSLKGNSLKPGMVLIIKK